ncbi:MAG: hypothetical protein E7158_02025 [Firmicutes bacterium]|nr:hypothetical protein [Bacillota bacterium]
MYLLKDEIKEFKDDKTKMSSLSQIGEFENCDVRKIGLGNKLLRSEIYTVYDLLTYSYFDLAKLKGVGDTYINKIKDIIHSYDLKFINELSDDEKRNIVALSSESMIDNSSLEWIISPNKSKIPILVKENVPNIGKLKEEIKAESFTRDDVIKYALDLGIYLGKNSKITSDDFDMTYRQLLSTNIKYIKMPTHMYNKLTDYSIYTMGDIVSHKKSFYNRVFYTSTKTKNAFYELVRSFGLFFRSEANFLKMYSDDIYRELDQIEDNGISRSLKK